MQWCVSNLFFWICNWYVKLRFLVVDSCCWTNLNHVKTLILLFIIDKRIPTFKFFPIINHLFPSITILALVIFYIISFLIFYIVCSYICLVPSLRNFILAKCPTPWYWINSVIKHKMNAVMCFKFVLLNLQLVVSLLPGCRFLLSNTLESC